ncbi:hypothetical protein A3F08_03125 [Candidatus Berkelbacteria bacterium RIFCSPHIGHO2_12_FULL_36_9]|uniref:HEPN domain-containing protein n=1 Tax=Candidatus Berkelbacteria bacterium RIFCSPHIGHO2_12_FULL_36_9 TaxID=1797469 RepID=A0A1F5EG56_9BACT|nr:MAG: hypothetical protein A3F08_03125 [Candidatus Berkelbacteria bacterium RIFCSPHIGHO2_12_FULL_36_9]
MKNQKNSQVNLKKLATEWFLKARDDELSAKDILTNKEGAASTVCFLSQQMAEKYLKGYLVFKEERFPKIHDLDRLVKLCQKIDSNFQKIKNNARYLSDFYVATRYPGDYPQFNFEQAEQAFQKALKIKKIVLNKIK